MANAGKDGYKWYERKGYGYEVWKYNTNELYGLVDGRTELIPEDDAATVALGGKWRIPTGDELRELKQNTDREYIDVNGVRCIKLTASNGNSIILPAAGHDMNPAMYEGWWYWTSTLVGHDMAVAYLPQFSGGIAENIGELITTNLERHGELSIRPVYGDRAPRTYVPYANTWDVNDCRFDGAVVRGSVTCLQSLDEVSEYGLCLSKTSDQPATGDTKVACSPSDGRMNGEDFEFTYTLTGLESETVYNIRTYAVVGGQTLYGRVLSFETLINPNSLDLTSKTVDLGLSVPWAGWNIGAESPQQTGGYFTWADPEDKTGGTCRKENYKWIDEYGSRYTKYVPSRESWAGVTADNLKVVRPADDAAFINWGENWRMPTREEWGELYENCSWKLMLVDGIQGYKVTGPNGNSIFLPLAGYVGSGGQTGVNETGTYWSSTQVYDQSAFKPDIRITKLAYCAHLDCNSANVTGQTDMRFTAFSVRAVWGDEPLSTPVEGVYLDKSSIELRIGESYALSATLIPVDPLDPAIAWSTSDAAVASVDNGLVTALSAGSATVTVTTHDGGFTASCSVVVKEPLPEIESGDFADI